MTTEVAEVPAHPDAALTGRQRAILIVIREHVDKWGFPPSVREIQAAVGPLSISSVHADLVQMEKHGVIKRSANRSRAITVLQAA